MVKTIGAARRRFEERMDATAVRQGGHAPASLDAHRLKHATDGHEANAYEQGSADFLGVPPESVGRSKAAFNYLDTFDTAPKRRGKSEAWIEGMRAGVTS